MTKHTTTTRKRAELITARIEGVAVLASQLAIAEDQFQKRQLEQLLILARRALIEVLLPPRTK